MKKISIFCPECKQYMLVDIDHDVNLWQDMVPERIANDLDNKTSVCEHCGVLYELKTKFIHRVDANVIF